MRSILKLCVSLLGLCLTLNLSAIAEDASKVELENVLMSFKNYRFGKMSVYKISSTNEIFRGLTDREAAASGIVVDESAIEGQKPIIIEIVTDGVKDKLDINDIVEEIINAGEVPPPLETVQAIINYAKSKEIGKGSKYEAAYVVTTRTPSGQVPDQIIAMIVSKVQTLEIEEQLGSVSSRKDIYTAEELVEFPLDTSYAAPQMYDLVMSEMVQQNYENMTLIAQGIGIKGFYDGIDVGVSEALGTNENTDKDIRKYIRLSEVQPEDMYLKQNKVILSPDLISWYLYDKPGWEEWDDAAGGYIRVIDSLGNSNATLPKIGFEVKYGIDEINYPSFWSERMTASVLWQNAKLGVILPTNGWSSMSEDLFDQDRNLTHASVGIAGSFDFPIKVIQNSGIFHMAFGHVFGDAEESEYKDRVLTLDGSDPYDYTKLLGEAKYAYHDYLIRSYAQVLYTFGMSIDKDYWFRFGAGFSMYSMEKWFYSTENNDGVTDIAFKKLGLETISGINIKMDFMNRFASTPYGATVQYFDETLYGRLWLQIPVIKNTLALRMEAKAFMSAFRGTKREWEPKNAIFFPMARLIVTF